MSRLGEQVVLAVWAVTWPRQECQTPPGNAPRQERSSKLRGRGGDKSSDTAEATSVSEKWELSASSDEYLQAR